MERQIQRAPIGPHSTIFRPPMLTKPSATNTRMTGNVITTTPGVQAEDQRAGGEACHRELRAREPEQDTALGEAGELDRCQRRVRAGRGTHGWSIPSSGLGKSRVRGRRRHRRRFGGPVGFGVAGRLRGDEVSELRPGRSCLLGDGRGKRSDSCSGD